MPISEIFTRTLDLGGNNYRQIAMRAIPPRRYQQEIHEETKEIVTSVYPPEGFTKWNLHQGGLGEIPASMTMRNFQKWLETQHGLRLHRWLYTYGKHTEAQGGNVREKVYAATLFTHDVSLLPMHIPGLELSEYDARMTINENTAIPKPLRSKYIQRWKELRTQAASDSTETKANIEETLDFSAEQCADWTLLQLFQRIEEVVRQLRAEQRISEVFLPTISQPNHRRYLPISEGLFCRQGESKDVIDYIAPLLIRLDL